MSRSDDKFLSLRALDFREKIIHLAHEHQFGVHIGGSLSLAEILTVLYFSVVRVKPQDPDWKERDRVILSKGHGNIGLLTILALRGFFSESKLKTFNTLGSYFTMHADSQVPGVEHSAGSLGHGLSVAVGMALAGKLDGAPWNVYCILGDGESMEGSVWEALMSAAHFQLDNLVAILDRNQLTQEGTTAEVMNLDPMASKVEAFGWDVYEVNGHDIQALSRAFSHKTSGNPKFILANTLKGYGLPSHQNKVDSHFGSLTDEQASAALELLDAERQRFQG